MDFLEKLIQEAKQYNKRIVLPESQDERILEAALKISQDGIATIILIGNEEEIKKKISDVDSLEIIDHLHSEKFEQYADELVELRKHKGMTKEKALEILRDENYFATMMVHKGDADGLVSGASHSTADTIRPALQIIKTKPNHSMVSSFFFMIAKDKTYIFSDCGVVIEPDAEQLSEIALSASESAKEFGIQPKVAMLSFSTHGSAKHDSLQKVIEATLIIKKKRPDLIIDGELQLDAAIVPEVCKKKCPHCSLKGDANVLIFPDLNAGNIGYKLVERFGGVSAIGPIMQGLKKPVNDLSRGCSVQDIYDLVAITAVQAQKNES